MKEDRLDVAVRYAGLAVSFVGVGLLLTTFVLAIPIFSSPESLVPKGHEMSDFMFASLVLGARSMALFFMVLSASLIGSKGVGMYKATKKRK